MPPSNSSVHRMPSLFNSFISLLQGKLPYFVAPPMEDDDEEDAEGDNADFGLQNETEEAEESEVCRVANCYFDDLYLCVNV